MTPAAALRILAAHADVLDRPDIAAVSVQRDGHVSVHVSPVDADPARRALTCWQVAYALCGGVGLDVPDPSPHSLHVLGSLDGLTVDVWTPLVGVDSWMVAVPSLGVTA